MKIWQCSQCRECLEDCKLQCQAITDDDIKPDRCLQKSYPRFPLGWKGDWKEISVDDLLAIDGLEHNPNNDYVLKEKNPNDKHDYFLKLNERISKMTGKEIDEIFELDFEGLKKLIKNFDYGYDEFYFIIERFVDYEKLQNEYTEIQGHIYPVKSKSRAIGEFCEFLKIFEALLPRLAVCLIEYNMVNKNGKKE